MFRVKMQGDFLYFFMKRGVGERGDAGESGEEGDTNVDNAKSS
jgi:hypothetical protein